MATVVEEYAVFKNERSTSPSPPARLTLEQANKLAEGQPFELIEGRMVFKMADQYHGQTQILLDGKLLNYFIANPIGRVMSEVNHRLWPENPYQGRLPDLSVMLNEHLQLDEPYPTRAPDIAIEIISEDDIWTKLVAKAKLCFEKGSREVWFVDPYEKNMLVLTPTTRRWVLDTLTSELLPGFQVELKDIFFWPGTAE